MDGENQKYYSARINFRSKEEFDKFRQVETILIICGENLVDFMNGLLDDVIGGNSELMAEIENFVDGAKLMEHWNNEDARQITRGDLFKLRDGVLVAGKDYFSSAIGDGKPAYRYYLPDCISKIKDHFGILDS